jgi:hypothetical protein
MAAGLIRVSVIMLPASFPRGVSLWLVTGLHSTVGASPFRDNMIVCWFKNKANVAGATFLISASGPMPVR